MQVIGKELGTTTDLGSDQPTHQIDSAANDVVRHPMLISFTSGNIACVITSSGGKLPARSVRCEIGRLRLSLPIASRTAATPS